MKKLILYTLITCFSRCVSFGQIDTMAAHEYCSARQRQMPNVWAKDWQIDVFTVADSVMFDGKGGRMMLSNDGKFTIGGAVILDTVLNIPRYSEQDTLPVLLLCADTSLHYFTMDNMHVINIDKGKHPQDTISTYNASLVYWIKGYQVNKLVLLHWEANDIQVPTHYEISEYLDENKKPLAKSILVWMAK